LSKQTQNDYVLFWEIFCALDRGKQAELRRHVRQPDELAELPAFYALYRGIRPNRQHQRVAFFLPVCKHREGALSIGAQLAKKDVSEMRIFQVIRSEQPNDLIQLRRLCQHIEPIVDWEEFGDMLWFWGHESKRKLLEDYFVFKYNNTK